MHTSRKLKSRYCIRKVLGFARNRRRSSWHRPIWSRFSGSDSLSTIAFLRLTFCNSLTYLLSQEIGNYRTVYEYQDDESPLEDASYGDSGLYIHPIGPEATITTRNGLPYDGNTPMRLHCQILLRCLCCAYH